MSQFDWRGVRSSAQGRLGEITAIRLCDRIQQSPSIPFGCLVMVSKAIHDGCSRLLEVIGVGVRTAQDDRPIHFSRIQGPVRDADNRVRQIEAICDCVTTLRRACTRACTRAWARAGTTLTRPCTTLTRACMTLRRACTGLLVSCDREPRSKLLARVGLNQAMQHLQRVVPRDLS